MAAAFEDNTLGPPESGHVFDWPAIQERPHSKLEVRYFIGDARHVALLLDFSDFWFNGRYQYYKFDGNLLDRNELVTLCGPDEAEKLRREPGRKLKAFFPEQGGWVPLRCLREVQAKAAQQQQQLQQEQAFEQDMGLPPPQQQQQQQQQQQPGSMQGDKSKSKASSDELGADDRMNGAYSGCRELTVPKEWARDEFRNCEFPLAIKLQVRLNGVLLPEQYDVKVSRDNRQDRASRRYRIALTSTLRELGELVQASKYISEWRRMSEELIIISVSNTAISLPLARPPEDHKEESSWDDEALAIILAAEENRTQPSTRARTLQKAVLGTSKLQQLGCASPCEQDEPVPGLRDLLHAMWTEQQCMLEQQVEEASVLDDKYKKLLAEHSSKVAALQQEHHGQLTKLQSKQQADVLKAVQRQYSDSTNQRNGHLIDQYRCELQLMNEKHGSQLGKLASKQEAELQALLEKQQQEVRKLEERMSRLAAEHVEALQGALLRHQDAVCSRVERHQVTLQDEWQRCLHLEEEEAAVTLATLADDARLQPAAAALEAATAASGGVAPSSAAPLALPQPELQPASVSTQQQPGPAALADLLSMSQGHPAAQIPIILAGASPSGQQDSQPQKPSPAVDYGPSSCAGKPAATALLPQPAAEARPSGCHLPSSHAASPACNTITTAATAAATAAAKSVHQPPHPANSLAGSHSCNLERHGSSPACLPAVEQPYTVSKVAHSTYHTRDEATTSLPGVQQLEPGSVDSASSGQKRAWSTAAGVDTLAQDSLQPPIKRPHKLMVKMVHA